VYISGQIALDKDGAVVGAGDMKAQAVHLARPEFLLEIEVIAVVATR